MRPDPPARASGPGAEDRSPSKRRLDDEESVRACQQGKRDAFDELVSRYQRDVYRICYRYVNNHQDADDLTQEAFLKAYRAISKFRGESAFSTWLYRIAVNVSLSFRSARKPQATELPDDLPEPGESASDNVLRAEKERRVWEAVSRLPEKQRATLILKVYQDLPHEEVARILGTSVGTTKANLFHALTSLRRLLEQGG